MKKVGESRWNRGNGKKALRVTSIIFGVVLVIIGIAILGFFGWLGYQISGFLSAGM